MTGAQNFHIGAGALSVEGEDVGLTTEEGVLVKYEPDVHLHMSGKYPAPVKASLVGIKLTLEVFIGEHTLENMERCYAGVTNSDGKIQFGGLAGREVEGKELILTPFDGTEKWYFRNAVPTEAVEAGYKVNDERVMHATFTALVDIDADEAENLGYFSS